MSDKRGFWYLLSGLLLGLGIGLWISWGLAPIQFVDTTPASLSPEFKDDYRFMIASAFHANNDLVRAQARLETLLDKELIKTLGEQAQRMLSENKPMAEVQLLADLSTAMQNPASPADSSSQEIPSNQVITSSPTTATNTATPSQTPTATALVSQTPLPITAIIQVTSSATAKPIATIPPRSTPTISPTPMVPFELIKKTAICEINQPGVLQVILLNSAGGPAAGIELVITWFSGEEHFFTGLKPELGLGYADFTMTENVEYALSLSAGGTRVTGLSLQKCSNPQGGKYPGGIRLEFKQP